MRKTVNLVFTLIVLVSLLGVFLWPSSGDEPAHGANILNLYGIDPYTLDPALSGDATSHQYITQIFSGLVRLNTELEVVAEIADTWSVSSCGGIYTFYLKDNVYFHSGRQLTAWDFKHSWERACTPATGSQTAELYLGDIQGAREMISGQADSISGIIAPDDYTLVVVIDEPKSYFIYKLTYPTAYVVDIKQANNDNWWHSGVNGTGPFKLKTWQPGNRLELERNTSYHGDVARLDGVVYHLWAGRVMDMYEKGEIDIAHVGAAYIDKVRDERNIFFNDLVEVPALTLMYLGFDFAAPPFDDPLVRLAFAMALDKEKIVKLVFKDTARQADGVLPPGIPGYNDSIEGVAFDPGRALALIAESGYGSVENLPPVTLTTGGYGGYISTELEAVVYQWREILGVDVTVRQLDPSEFYYNLINEKDELFYYGWAADYPHPQNFLEILFGAASPNNTGEYFNSSFEDIIYRAAREDDPQTSFELYRYAEQVLLDDIALIPLLFGIDQVLVKPYVHGYQAGPAGTVPLNKIWLDR